MADALREYGYEVELVEDEELSQKLSECSLLFLGADAVFPDGAIANRAGTSTLARAARALGIPVEVVVDAFKRQPDPEAFEPETVQTPGGLQPLFERVEAEWIDQIVGLEPKVG